MLDTMGCATTVVPEISNNLRENTFLRLASGGQAAHSLLRWLGLSHFECVKHDSNHRANHGENDGPFDEFFLQRFLPKRLVIHLIEHVPVPLSANNRGWLASRCPDYPGNQFKTLGKCSALILTLISRKTKKNIFRGRLSWQGSRRIRVSF